MNRKIAVAIILGTLFVMNPAYSGSEAPATIPANVETASTAPAVPPTKPYRTFITIQRYNLENSGVAGSVSNVRLNLIFPNGAEVQLPEGGHYWPIGNGQAQEINRTFEIPWALVHSDGFNFRIQMVRQGASLNPCDFEVTSLSQFNRQYVCHTDVNFQMNQSTPQDKLDNEGIQVRVFTDLNTPANEIPQQSLAVRP